MDKLCSEIHNVPLHVFDTKEEDYIIILISNYVTNGKADKEKFRSISGEIITIKSPESVQPPLTQR